MSCIICLDSRPHLIANRYCTCIIHWHQSCWDSYLANVNPPKCMSCRKVLNLSKPLSAEVPILTYVRPTAPQQTREPSELDMASIRTIIQLLETNNQGNTIRPSAPPVETHTSYTPLPSQPMSQGPPPMDPTTKKIVQTILGIGLFTVFFIIMYYFVLKN